MRLSWSSAVTRFSTNSEVLARISRQLLAHLAAKILIDLQDLKLDLGDFALGLGDRGDQRSTFSPQPCRLPLQRRNAGDRDQVLAPQFAHAFELLIDKLDLAYLGDNLLVQAAYLFLSLQDALIQLRLLTPTRRAAQLEEPSLPCQDPQNRRVGRTRQELLRKDQPFVVVSLRFESCLSRGKFI